MSLLDETCIDEVLAIQWFAHCGQPFEIEGFELETVGSWSASLAFWNGDRFNDLQGQQRSRLQTDLFTWHKRHHALWNEMIELVKVRLAAGGTRQAIASLLGHGFSELHLDVVMSHLRLAIMESSYSCQGCIVPRFFRTFLQAYSSGHLPCGWRNGEFPSGRLIVY